jgi:hypothetical protein
VRLHELNNRGVLHETVKGIAGIDLQIGLLLTVAHQQTSVDILRNFNQVRLGQVEVVVAGNKLAGTRPDGDVVGLFDQRLHVLDDECLHLLVEGVLQVLHLRRHLAENVQRQLLQLVISLLQTLQQQSQQRRHSLLLFLGEAVVPEQGKQELLQMHSVLLHVQFEISKVLVTAGRGHSEFLQTESDHGVSMLVQQGCSL